MNRQGMLICLFFIFFLSACKSTHPVVSTAQYKKNPKAAAVNVQLGLGYLQGGDTERAKHKLLIAEQQDPTSSVVMDAMGYYLELTGSISDAEKYYKKSISLAPNNGESLNNYGTFLCRQKHYQQAEKYFLKAIQDQNYVKSAEAFENAGLCAQKIPDIAKAKQYFNRALQQDPKRATSVYELASLDFQSGDYNQANRRLVTYLMLTEGDPGILLLAYKVSKKLGHSANANNYAEMIRTKFPRSKEIQQLQTGER